MKLTGFKHIFIFAVVVFAMIVSSCDFKSKIKLDNAHDEEVVIKRFDRLESRYLTTGDFAALQKMSTEFPTETSTLIERILHIGKVTESDINSRFLSFFQDSTLQTIITESEYQYADMSDLEEEFDKAFEKISTELPKVIKPQVYAQIGGLNESIIINNNTIGISIDKYLGYDYSIYKKYYSKSQRKDMVRDKIVPDAIGFYLVSLYTMPQYNERTQLEKDLYLGKIMWATNYLIGRKAYNTTYVRMVNNYMNKYKNINLSMLLENNDYEEMIKTNRE